jgi:thiol-disulfide isomerase/thioredoxin
MMDILLIASRAVLALVFAVSAAGKLADLAGSRRAVAGFGVPARLATPIGTALPLAEIALALLLLPAATAWWGALGALVLLLGFTAGMGAALARGEQPDCNCFGAIHSEPVSRTTMLRNGALAAGAAFVVFGGWGDPGPGVFAWLADAAPVDAAFTAAGLTLLVAIAIGAVTVRALSRRIGALDAQLQEARAATPGATPAVEEDEEAILQVPVGTMIPAFAATALDGTRVVFEEELHRGRQFLLVFVNPACTACERVLPRLARWQEQLGDRVAVLAISHGDLDQNRAKAERTHFPPARYLVQEEHEVSAMFGVERVPLALHVGADGSLASPVAGGAEAIGELLDAVGTRLATRPSAAHPVLKRIRAAFGQGDILPQLTAMQDGTTPTQLPLAGRRTLMLFWNPGCPFCQRFLLQLRQWETQLPHDVTLMLLVKPGETAAAREHGLRAAIIEDDGVIRAHYEVSGTPVTVLAGADGTLAAPIAFGLGASQALVQDLVTVKTELAAS